MNKIWYTIGGILFLIPTLGPLFYGLWLIHPGLVWIAVGVLNTVILTQVGIRLKKKRERELRERLQRERPYARH